MAPLSTNAISHFMHPAHKLNHRTTNESYICDGCNILGTGSRFSCTSCGFDLHEYCAICPTRLNSTTHHQHPMSLVVHKPVPNQTESCQICCDPVNGLAYQCKNCNFWAHPLCVSSNTGHNKDPTAPSRSSSAPPLGSGAAAGPFAYASNIGQQVGVGLGTNYLYDQIKDDLPGLKASGSNEVPSTGVNASVSNDVPSTGVDASFSSEGDGGGLLDTILSLFSSSS